MELIGLETLAARLRYALESSPGWRMNHLLYWTLWRVVGYVILPVLVIRGILGERVSDFGLRLSETWTYRRFYLLLLLGMAPVVVVASFHPDLLLVDVDMGSCQGTAVVEALLDRSFVAQVVIVLHSSLGGAELEALATECGAHGFIRKTDDPEALLRQVRRFLFSGVPDGPRR